MEPQDFVEYEDQHGRLYYSTFVRWPHVRGSVHCLMQAVFLPGNQLKLFLAQVRTCPSHRGIFYEEEKAANAAWLALQEHFPTLSPPLIDAPGRHPDEKSFLAHIFGAPDDDVTRLVFADWLDEHDEPDKAAFVRLEVETNRLPKDKRSDERLWVDFARLERATGKRWGMALIRPAQDVEWLFRYGQFSSYDFDPYAGTVRHNFTLDSERQWRYKKYNATRLKDQDEAQVMKLTAVPEVEDELKKLPREPPKPGEY